MIIRPSSMQKLRVRRKERAWKRHRRTVRALQVFFILMRARHLLNEIAVRQNVQRLHLRNAPRPVHAARTLHCQTTKEFQMGGDAARGVGASFQLNRMIVDAQLGLQSWRFNQWPQRFHDARKRWALPRVTGDSDGKQISEHRE